MGKKHIMIIFVLLYIISTFFFLKKIDGKSISGELISNEKIGKMCVAQVYPAIGCRDEGEKAGSISLEVGNIGQEVKKTETVPKMSVKKIKAEKEIKVKNNGKPLVIIYHTHSTESYQPYSAGNFHSTKATGTVRDVGTVLANGLRKQGIGVIHNKQIHDRPSYNQSYSRSLETVTGLMKKNRGAVYIIDLHRDAAAYSGNVGKTVKIEGKTVAKYSLVVGRNNANFRKLMSYAGKVNATAKNMYPGFEGRIIEKQYRYNEYISDYCMLLEIGNNQNNIKEAKTSAKYLAKVLAKVIKEK